MDITPDKKNIVELVKAARDGRIVLPQFQRSFVWAYSDVQDLLVSILKGYFIGSFLVQRCDRDNTPFAIRAIEGVVIPTEHLNPEFMILDGQQRLTTLHYVLHNPKNIALKFAKYPYRFFLKLDEVASDNIEQAVFGEREEKCVKWFDKKWQFENRAIPFSVLQDFHAWDEWLDDYHDWLRENDEDGFDRFWKQDRPRWKDAINKLFKSEMPVIEIPKVENDDEQGIAETCAIFEKMNSTGVDLSVFDLLTARLYKYREHDIDLHALWEETVEEYDLIREFSEGEPNPFYGIFILRFIAMLRGLDVKSKFIINLHPDQFKEQWRLASDYINKALVRITATNQDGFGVFDRKWQPYPPLVVVMAAALHEIETKKHGDRAYQALKKWYWGSVFGERYQSAVESSTLKDFTDLKKYFNGDVEVPDIFKEIDNLVTNNPNFTLKEVSRTRSSRYKGVMNLLALNGARDFRYNDSIEFHTLDDHHIFPKSFLAKQKDDNGKRRFQDKDINVILNRTLISSATNNKIKDRAPSDYISDDAVILQQYRSDILSAHFIDDIGAGCMFENDINGFINARNDLLVQKVKEQLQL